jgi:hypothetical protein
VSSNVGGWSKGHTEQHVIKTLHFGTNQIHEAFGRLQKQLRSVPNGSELRRAI